ncbi:hypothetical protein LY76DRAFT_528655 [Colletotrichum caudatum]|nr:hypothetical protein LY76DRAFT_528655 [Colletotrichum caudatum]
MKTRVDFKARVRGFFVALYLFGKSDIPVASLPSIKNQIDGVEEDRISKPHRPLPSGRLSEEEARVLYHVLFASMWAAALYNKTVPCTLTYTIAIVMYNEGGLAAIPVGHAQDFRDRSADAKMGRKTIPLLLSQQIARWSLAALMISWTVGLIALWEPPAVASVTFAALGLRSMYGFVSSHDEKDDYVSYCWYGFWLLGSNLLPIFSRLKGEL